MAVDGGYVFLESYRMSTAASKYLCCEGLEFLPSSTHAYAGAVPIVAVPKFTSFAGTRTCIVGLNGAGKTTFMRLLAGELPPTSGVVSLSAGGRVALLHQNPANQLLASRVFEDVAMGPQNLGLDREEIVERVSSALSVCGIQELLYAPVAQLSGGQQALVVLAGLIAMQPDFLLLDEVCAQLDSSSRQRVRQVIDRLVAQGMGVIEISHYLSDCFTADAIVLLEDGSPKWQGEVEKLVASDYLLARSGLTLEGLGGFARAALELGVPAAELCDPANLDVLIPVLRELQHAANSSDTVVTRATHTTDFPTLDVATWPFADLRSTNVTTLQDAPDQSANGAVLIGRNLKVRYPDTLYFGQVKDCSGTEDPSSTDFAGDKNLALVDLDIELAAGELCVVAGRSGSGKTTLARVLCGLMQPTAGEVRLLGRAPKPGEVGLALQNPAEQLFSHSVLEDVAFGPLNRGLEPQAARARAREALEFLGLSQELIERHPQELSGGEQRLCALAGVVALGVRAYVFDEPTSSLDPDARERFHRFVQRLLARGAAVCVITHDVSEWLGQAQKVVLLAHGKLAWQGEPAELARYPERFAAAGLEAPLWLSIAHKLAADQITIDNSGETASSSMTGHATADKSEPAATCTNPELRMSTFPAGAKLILWFALLVAVFTAGPIGLLTATFVVAASLAWAHVPPTVALRGFKPMVLIFLVSLLFNALVLDGTGALALVGPVGISVDGALRAARALARVALMLEASIALMHSSDTVELTHALCAPLQLVARHVPRGDWADALEVLLSLALRFVPLSVQEFDRVRLAQAARGARLSVAGQKSWRRMARALKTYQSVLVPVLFMLVQRADAVAQALVARGFGAARRTRLTPAWTWWDTCGFVLGLGICVLIAIV